MPVGMSVAVAVLMSGVVVMPAAKATGTVNTIALAAPASMRAVVAPKLVCPVVPVTVPQFATPAATHVALADSVTPAGNGSETVTLFAFDGPALVTVTVYVAAPPGVYVGLPSVLVTASAATAERASLSEPDAGGEAGSVAVAVLINGFVTMPGANDTGTVNVSELPAPAPTVAPVVPKLVWPVVPVTVPQFDAPAATQMALPVKVTPAGRGSATVTLFALDGPAFVTTTVYVVAPPGVYVGLPSVLVTASAATAARASLSEPLAGGDAGSVDVAVLTRGFVTMPAANATGTVNVSELPAPAPTDAPVVPKLV
jgi:hypothetical protein